MDPNNLGFRSKLVDGFLKIVLITFGPFKGHHQGFFFACVKSVNSSTNLKLKPTHLSGNLKGS